jgi:hypothetical protein
LLYGYEIISFKTDCFVLQRLEVKREAHGRPEKLEECTQIQLAEEKAAVQRALLWLEGARGRPTARIDRDAARPLYDRYRAVKRLVAKFDAVNILIYLLEFFYIPIKAFTCMIHFF